jgi:hypothetical protein
MAKITTTGYMSIIGIVADVRRDTVSLENIEKSKFIM